MLDTSPEVKVCERDSIGLVSGRTAQVITGIIAPKYCVR